MYRYDIINMLIDANNYESYLEIGVANKSVCFDKIKCKHKESVDPGLEFLPSQAEHKMTSDEFFRLTSPLKKWDIIFIDGLHLADQVIKDIRNSLRHLNERGSIILHDTNPSDKWAAAEDHTDAKDGWNGTVWKAVVYVNYNFPDIGLVTIDTDFGVTIMQKLDTHRPIFYHPNPMYEFNNFLRDKKEQLNLIPPHLFKELILNR